MTTATQPKLHAPHNHIKTSSAKERFLIELFDTLWERYRERMEYVRTYEQIVAKHGATFVNDHIAFRTFAAQKPTVGVHSISRIIEALGYTSAAAYEFPDKKLSAMHFQHPNPQFPRIFISQLRTWELSPAGRKIVEKALKTHRAPLADATLAQLFDLEKLSEGEKGKLLKALVKYFAELPWDLPQKADVTALDKESQYAAWVLVNGYDVNHFTASIDSHGVDSLGDIEKTIDAMRGAGIPMKKEIEGERGTKLRQSATESVMSQVAVKDGSRKSKMQWSYAYFEIAERPPMKNPQTGAMERFQGFLGGQATNLFDMTKLKK